MHILYDPANSSSEATAVNLKQLDAFRAVMRTGSVTNAAQMLHVTQPSVSRLIADLERSVGFRLFKRVKGMVPIATPEAEILLQEVERSFTGIQELKRIATDIKNLRTGQLRIACLPALSTGFVPSAIQAFVADHPSTRIHLQTRSSSTVRIWVAAQQFDFGFATPAGEIAGLISEPFVSGRGVCVLPPKHPLANRRVIRPSDLVDQPFISLALEDPARRKIDNIFEQAGIERNIVVETQYAMTICGLVQRGVGCTILNPVTALDFVPLGLVLKPFEPAINFEYMLYRPAHRPLSLVADRFIALLREERTRLARRGLVQGI